MQNYSLITDFHLAEDSNDHRFPRGTKNDDTHCPEFVKRCEELFSEPSLQFLDLGCSSGGLVLDFQNRGHRAFGIEGSDYSKLHRRGAWSLIPDSLATGDISQPFLIRNGVTQFNIISAWEVLEHISENRIYTTLMNIYYHLDINGIFVASIATISDKHKNVEYHQTIRPRTWWECVFSELGFRLIEPPFSGNQWPRGPHKNDWLTLDNTSPGGFYIVAEIANK